MRSHTTSSSSSSSLSSSSVFSRRTTAYVHTQNWTNATLPCSTTSPHATTIITVKHSNNMNINKNYFLSNSSSVQCNFFIFDHVTFIQFKICCCVQNFNEISTKSDDFSPRYGDILIFKMAAVRHLGIVLPPYETSPRSLCCRPQLPVKCHVNLIHRCEDIAIWIFRIFGLKCLFRPQ